MTPLHSKAYTEAYTDTLAWLDLGENRDASQQPVCPDTWTVPQRVEWQQGADDAINDYVRRQAALGMRKAYFDEGFDAAIERSQTKTMENPVCKYETGSLHFIDWWAGYQAGLDEIKAKEDAQDAWADGLVGIWLGFWYRMKVIFCYYGIYSFIKTLYIWLFN